MSKWNKWKLIHKETQMTFSQYINDVGYVNTKSGSVVQKRNEQKWIPVILQSGIPAVYIEQDYYPYLFFLKASDWLIQMNPATENTELFIDPYLQTK